MSPEQAGGKAIDKRTDIWAFGCVFYEMLTGTLAFKGESVADTIAAILERELDLSLVPMSSPRGVHLLLRRCLQKDVKRRLRDIADARMESSRAGNRTLWTARGDLTQSAPLTNGAALDDRPVYSPDGRQVTFVSDRTGRRASGWSAREEERNSLPGTRLGRYEILSASAEETHDFVRQGACRPAATLCDRLHNSQ
jgi:serine/threonine protein kinase